MKISKLSGALCLLALCAGVISVRAQDNPAQAAARALLEQQFQSMKRGQSAATTTNAQPVLKDPQPAATLQATPPNTATNTAIQNPDAAAQQKRAEEQRAAFLTPTPPQNPAINARGFKPIVAPPLPISAAKQAQLNTLLDMYKADRITPANYQKQRAAILAGPE